LGDILIPTFKGNLQMMKEEMLVMATGAQPPHCQH